MTTATATPFKVVLPASAPRADWLAARRLGIGSSDIPQVMGVTGFGSAQHVYYDKRGEIAGDDDAGESALWGTLHEETVAREWARRNRTTVRRVGLVARRDAPWMMCTLDRRCTECPLNRAERETCAVEVKTRNAFGASKWRRQVPDDVLAQVLWQIATTGYDHVHVACLIGGSDYRQYVVRRKGNEDLIRDIVTVASRLWDDIGAGRVPALTGEERTDPLLDLFDRVHPERSGLTYLDEYPAMAVAVTEDLLEYEVQRLTERDAKKAKEAAKVRLIERLKGGEAGVLHGEVAYAWPLGDGRATADLARLAELYPDAYADCVSATPSRRFELDKARRLKELP